MNFRCTVNKPLPLGNHSQRLSLRSTAGHDEFDAQCGSRRDFSEGLERDSLWNPKKMWLENSTCKYIDAFTDEFPYWTWSVYNCQGEIREGTKRQSSIFRRWNRRRNWVSFFRLEGSPDPFGPYPLSHPVSSCFWWFEFQRFQEGTWCTMAPCWQ